MAKGMVKSTKSSSRKIRPALSAEARENQMISLAVDLAEKQLQEGTASSQVITHFLKLGSTKERLEKERLIEENKLIRAKVESLESARKVEQLYAEAIKAMNIYKGNDESNDEEVW